MLTRWSDSFRDLQFLHDRMSRLFDDTFAGTLGRGTRDEGMSSMESPPVDIYETRDYFGFTVEVPGFKQEDLSVTIENGVLTIQGERRMEEKQEGKNFHRMERAYGKFQRTFTLPGNVNPENINASLNDGILRIEVAKREEAKPKSIPIGIGGPKQIASKAASAKS
jgi:HSP20 family protein